MMHNDSSAILDDLLSRWHSWARSYSPVPTCGADPMFRNAKSAKGWDTTDQVVEDELNDKTMKAIDFQVGEMVGLLNGGFSLLLYILLLYIYYYYF